MGEGAPRFLITLGAGARGSVHGVPTSACLHLEPQPRAGLGPTLVESLILTRPGLLSAPAAGSSQLPRPGLPGGLLVPGPRLQVRGTE